MFDPIAFDNLKVIIEGDLYDLDLEGQIQVVDRKDIIDLARMSRNFAMDISTTGKIIGRVELSSDIENIAGELQSRIDRPGCTVKVSFFRELKDSSNYQDVLTQWKKELQTIWGVEWNISFFATFGFEKEVPIKLSAEIHFNRFIYEDNVDDLRALLVYVIDSLE